MKLKMIISTSVKFLVRKTCIKTVLFFLLPSCKSSGRMVSGSSGRPRLVILAKTLVFMTCMYLSFCSFAPVRDNSEVDLLFIETRKFGNTHRN